MQRLNNHFEEVTLLITHFNRPKSLLRLLRSVEELSMSFGEVLVSDDCSNPENLVDLEKLNKEGKIRLLTSAKNGGLQRNLNKAHRAVLTLFTLYIQEDFVPYPEFVSKFKTSLDLLKADEGLDMVRYYSYYKYPYITPVSDGFSEMNFSFFSWGWRKFALYSDHPHLRRSTFVRKFGKFKEGINSDKAEFWMMMSVLQNKGRGLLYDQFRDLFDQKNDMESSSLNRADWTEKRRFSKNIFIIIVRQLYRHIGFHTKYLFFKYKQY